MSNRGRWESMSGGSLAMHRITCSASGCSESIDICPEVVGNTIYTAFCQRAQGWGKAKRSSHVYCFAHRTQTARCGPEYNHPFCWGRHNSTSTSGSSSTAVRVHPVQPLQQCKCAEAGHCHGIAFFWFLSLSKSGGSHKH